MIYINKYIRDGYVESETFHDDTEARMAARRGGPRFNFPYATTLIFDRSRDDVSKFVREVSY